MIMATPAQFLLGVHGDAWRNEGHAGLMAVLSVGVTLANIALKIPSKVIQIHRQADLERADELHTHSDLLRITL